MTIDPSDIRLEEAASKGRYVYRAGDDEAEMTFSKAGARLVIIDHTEVPAAFRGQGVGPALVARGVADARAAGKSPAALPVRRRAVPPASRMGRRAAAEEARMSWNPASTRPARPATRSTPSRR